MRGNGAGRGLELYEQIQLSLEEQAIGIPAMTQFDAVPAAGSGIYSASGLKVDFCWCHSISSWDPHHKQDPNYATYRTKATCATARSTLYSAGESRGAQTPDTRCEGARDENFPCRRPLAPRDLRKGNA